MPNEKFYYNERDQTISAADHRAVGFNVKGCFGGAGYRNIYTDYGTPEMFVFLAILLFWNFDIIGFSVRATTIRVKLMDDFISVFHNIRSSLQ